MKISLKTIFGKLAYKPIRVWIVLLVLGICSLSLFCAAFVPKVLPLYDFVEYWAAGKIFLQGGNPYSKSELLLLQHALGLSSPDPIMMWNPPWTLILVSPFSLMPYAVARALWLVLALVFLLGAADFFWKMYGGPSSRRWLSWLGAITFFPSGSAIYLGQISPIMLLGLTGFFWSLQRKRHFLAGISISLVAVKPQVLYLIWIFLIFWICKERTWKVAAGLFASLFLALFTVSLYNPSIIRYYVEALHIGSGPLVWQTPTWGVLLRMVFPKAGQWLRFLPVPIGIGIAIYQWKRWRAGFSWQSHILTILLLSVITSSFTWMFDWIVLLPLVSLILVWFQISPGRLWWLPAGYIAIELIMLHQPALSHSNFFSIWMPPALAILFFSGKRAFSALHSVIAT